MERRRARNREPAPQRAALRLVVARHWREAGQNARAVERLVHAAEQSERGWAKDHAVRLYQEAIELLEPGDEEQRRQLRRRLALASQALYHVPDVRRPGSPPA